MTGRKQGSWDATAESWQTVAARVECRQLCLVLGAWGWDRGRLAARVEMLSQPTSTLAMPFGSGAGAGGLSGFGGSAPVGADSIRSRTVSLFQREMAVCVYWPASRLEAAITRDRITLSYPRPGGPPGAYLNLQQP